MFFLYISHVSVPKVPGIDNLDNVIDVMQNDKCIRMATKSDSFTP